MKRRLIASILAVTMMAGSGADLVPAAGRFTVYAEEAATETAEEGTSSAVSVQKDDAASAVEPEQTEEGGPSAGESVQKDDAAPAVESGQTEEGGSSAGESAQTDDAAPSAMESVQAEHAAAVLQKSLLQEATDGNTGENTDDHIGENTGASQVEDAARTASAGNESAAEGQEDKTAGVEEQEDKTAGVEEQEVETAGVDGQEDETAGVEEQEDETAGVEEQEEETVDADGQDENSEIDAGILEGVKTTAVGSPATVASGDALLFAAPNADAGSSLLSASSDTATSDSDSGTSLLQEMIQKAIDAVSGALEEKLTVILTRNTIYTGNVDITDNILADRTVNSGFVLELAAEDAGADGMQADGSILFTGDMTIKNIPVIIKGMGLQGAVTVQEAILNYYGTAADDDVNVTVTGDDASAEILTGDGADNISVEAVSGGSVNVHAGDGSDRVRAIVTKDGKAGIYTGAGADTITLQQGDGDVVLNAGDDDDTIRVTDLGGTGTLMVKAGSGSDSVSIKGQEDASSSTKRDKIDIDLGAGMDEAEIDLSAAAAVKEIAIKGAGDRDRLHLTGYLDSKVAEDSRITGTTESMTLQGSSGILKITASDIESFTDDLKNKRTVKLVWDDFVQNGDGYDYTAADAFTNYVYYGTTEGKNGTDEISGKSLYIRTKDGQILPLTSFVLDARAAGDGNMLSYGGTPDTKLYADDLQVVLRGKSINIGADTTIRAGLIRTEAYSGTTAGAAMIDLPLTETNIPVDVLNISDKAQVVIDRKAVLQSFGDILIQAKAEQDSGLITLYPGMNLLELKLAKALIDVSGTLSAGYGTGNAGSVHITAATDTTAGIDRDGSPYSGLPFAVTMAGTDAVINVTDATISATDSIRLGTRNRLEVSTRSDSTNGLPVSVAVSVLTADSRINVENSTLTAEKDVILSASGDLDAATIADRSEGQKGVSGGYVSVAVALQHVKAELGRDAVISAGRDVTIQSTARERVETLAEAAPEEAGSGDDGTITEIYQELTGLWDDVRSFFQNDPDTKDGIGELDEAVGKVTVSGYSVTVDEASRASGNVTVESVEKTDKNVTAKVTVSPYAGYEVRAITCLGLIPGETAYVVGMENEDGSWSFPAGTKDITVFVEYEGSGVTEEDEEAEAAEPDLFGDGDGDVQAIRVDEMVENITGSMDDVSEDGDAAGTSGGTVPLTFVKNEGGAILTYETIPDPEDSGNRLSMTKAAPGQEIRLVINPEADKLLKKGSLKVTFTVEEDGKSVKKTVVVNPDGDGRYYVTIPENVAVSDGVRIEAKFVDADNEDVEAGHRGAQLAGSVALTVADNDNRAVIGEGAKVTAGEDTNVSAVGATDVSSLADGTAITGQTASGTETEAWDRDAISRIEAVSVTETNVSEEEGLSHNIRIRVSGIKDKTGVISGSFTYDGEHSPDGEYAFLAAPAADKGFALSGTPEASWVDEDGMEHRRELTYAETDGRWHLDASDIPEGTDIVVSGVFEADTHAFSTQSSEHGHLILHDDEVRAGDEPVITVIPDAGYTVEKVAIEYTAADGTKETWEQIPEDRNGDKIRFTVPVLESGSVIHVSAEFVQKSIPLFTDTDSEAFSLSENYAATGDTVTIIPSEERLEKGYGVVSFTVTDFWGNVVYSGSGDSWEVPAGAEDFDMLTFTPVFGQKEIALKETELDHGSVIPVYPRVSRGETVSVRIDPEDNYRIRQGSLKAVIRRKDGSYTEEVYMARQTDFLYTFLLPEDISQADLDDLEITFTGTFEEGQSGEGTTTNLGAALAITEAQSHNRADIRGQVKSGDIRAEAFGNDSVRTEAIAGYSSGDTGIGGALSIQVASVDSKARIFEGAGLDMNGKLAAEAEEHAVFFVDADASGSKRQAKELGAGIGIAVGVNGADAVAAVQDGVKLTASVLDSVVIRADQTVQDHVSGAAGANSGKTALAAVAAADITGTSANAYLGRVTDGGLAVSNAVSISASNIVTHTVGAEGAAAGTGTGLGAAIGASVVTDVAKAQLAESLTAGQLDVSAVTESIVKNVATATAAGGRTPFRLGLTDSLKAKLLMAVADLAVLTGNLYINEDQLHAVLQYRLRVITTEGTLGLSGAAAANVQKSRSIAGIKDDVNVNVAGKTSVNAENHTEAVVKADGSTVNSTTGIGVGAALNFVEIDNIARVGTGTVQTGSLEVSAITREKSPEYTGVPAIISDRTDMEDVTREAVGEYVSDLVSEVGLGDLLTDEDGILGDVFRDIVDDVVQEVSDSGELFDFIDDIRIGDWIDAVLNEDKMHSIGDRIAIPVLVVFGVFVEIPDTELDKYRDNFVDTFKETFMSYLGDEVAGMAGGILKSTLQLAVVHQDKDRFAAEVHTEIGRMSKDIVKKALNKAVKASLKSLKWTTDDILDDVLDELDPSGKLAQSIDLDDIIGLFGGSEGSNTDSGTTEGGTSGTAGQTAADMAAQTLSFTEVAESLADELSADMADRICADTSLDAAADALTEANIPTVVSGAVAGAAEENNIVLNDEQLAILQNPEDLLLEGHKSSYGSHLIDTQAISGAGSTGIGLAGSAAITKLNAVTRAEIADTKDTTEKKVTEDGKEKTVKETTVTPGGTVTVTGDMRVVADEKRIVNTVASAALNAKGSAAARISAAEEANMDVGDSDDVQSVAEGKSVKLTVGFGGTAEIENSEISKDRPKIRITLKPGFKLETNKTTGKSYATFSYNDESGYEVTGRTIEVREDEEGLYIDTADLTALGIDTGTEVYIELNPEEDLHEVAAPTVSSDSEMTFADGDVTVGVKNREPVGNTISARAGDVVTVTVKKADGRRLETLSYTYRDANGKVHTADINPSVTTPGHEQIFSMVSVNSDEFVFTFRMPDGEVTSIDAHFVKGSEADAGQGPYSTFRLSTDGFTTNGTGRGVGAGASFAMISGRSVSEAVIGRRGDADNGVTAGSLTVDAVSEHEETVAGVAGTDPLSSASSADDGSHISLDASAAVNMLDNSIRAVMAEENKTTTTGYKEGDVNIKGDLSVAALEEGTSTVSASAFNVGIKTAIGATVALNMGSSDIEASLGSVTAGGGVTVAADSHSRDYTSAVASAVGQDIERIRKAAGFSLDEDDGTASPKEGASGNADNTTASAVNARLNQNKDEDGQEADNNLPLSINVLRSQNVKTKDKESEEENQSAWEDIQDGLGFAMTGVGVGYDIYNFFMGSKFQVAAAVGLTKAEHKANVTVGSVNAADAIRITAENNGNFATVGTSAAASILLRSNSISGGAAVTQSKNKAVVNVKGNLEAGSRTSADVTVTSTLTQNMDEDFADRLTAQALSGALSGPYGTMSVGGAVSLVQSQAESSVNIAAGTADHHRTITGQNITIASTDKSRLNTRAGGVSISLGSTIGIGASSSVLMSENTVSARVGDYTDIRGISLTLNAEKQKVTGDDYRNLLAIRDKEDNDDLIGVEESSDKKENTAKVNLYADKVLNAFEGINEYAFQNNYAEALSGSVSTSWGGASVAGSAAVIISKNTVEADLGSNVKVGLYKNMTVSESENDMTVSALDDTTTRAIGGSLSASASGSTAGVTVGMVMNKDTAEAKIGDSFRTTNVGSLTQKADVKGTAQVFTAAAGVGALGEESSNAYTATLNLIKIDSAANAVTGKNADILSSGKASVTSGTELDLTALGVNATVSMPGFGDGGLAAGGTMSLIRDKASALTDIGEGSTIWADGDVTVSSDISDQMISGAASQAAAFSAGLGIAAGVNVVSSGSKAKTTLNRNTSLISDNGSVDVMADSDAWMLNATAALPGAIGTAMGGSVNVNLLEREASVEMAGAAIDAGQDVRIGSNAENDSVMAGLVMGGSVEGLNINGNLVLQKEANKVSTVLGGESAGTTVRAGRNAEIYSRYDDDTKAAAGSVSLANMSAAVGVSDITLIKENAVSTVLGKSRVSAGASSDDAMAELPDGRKVRGIYVGADVSEKQLLVGAGVSLSGSAGVTATSANVKSENIVLADASAAALTTSENAGTGNITVNASDKSKRSLYAGGVNFGLAAGIGATALVVSSENDVKALVKDADASGDLDIGADNEEDLTLLNISGGGSPEAAVEIGATVISLNSRANALTGSGSLLHGSTIHLKATNTTDMTNIAAALGIGGKVAAIPVFVYNGFNGETNAILGTGTVNAGTVIVAADSGKTIHQYTVGAAFSGSTALSGAVTVTIAKDRTNALVTRGAVLNDISRLDIDARSNYTQTAITGAVGASGETAATVNGIVNILRASTLSEVEGEVNGAAEGSSGSVNVFASAKRDVTNVAANVAGSGVDGVGVTVMVLEAGDRMDEDAAHQLTYGSSSDGKRKAFNSSDLVKKLKSEGVDTSSMTNLTEDLEGNGHKVDANSLSTVTGKAEFDASSGYNSQSTADDDDGTTTETAAIANARNFGSTAYSDDPQDSVAARIGGNAKITARDVRVEAEQETLADLYGATIGVGGEIGGGISFAVARMRSNVIAASIGQVTAGSGSLTVNAVSRSGEVTPEAGSEEESRMQGILSKLKGLSPKKRSIRALGLVASASGELSAAISAGGVRMDNITSATLGGKVTAGSVNVNSDALYSDILAATLALSLGGVGSVASSVALAVAEGTVSSKVDTTAEITGDRADVNVTTNSVINADSVAAAAAFGGTAGVVAGLSMAANNLTQNTIVERGATITDSDGSLNVHGESDTNANALLMGVSAGLVSIGMGVGIARVKPNLNTTVGVDGGKTSDAVKYTTLNNLSDVNITNTVTSTAKADMVSGTVGGAAVAGNVLLVYNDTEAVAKAADVTGNIYGDFTINGKLAATGTSQVLSAAIGGAAVGVTVNHVDVNAKNTAELNTDNFKLDVGGTLSVTAGEKQPASSTEWNTQAIAKSMAGNIGAVTIGVNTAVARNRSLNDAIITGSSLKVNKVVLGSYGTGTADAYIAGVTEGAINIATSVVLALNETKDRAYMNLKGALKGDLTAETDVRGSTKARLLTGTGAIAGNVTTNVATARGLTVALTDVRIGAPDTEKHSFVVSSKGNDDVSTTIENLALVGVLTVATMVGRAFSKDVYDAKLALSGGKYLLDKVSVTTDYTTNIVSDVTPSTSGVEVSAVNVAVNKATSKSTAYAGASLSLEKATLATDYDVDVLINGNAVAKAEVHPAQFAVNLAVGVGVNKANAVLSGTQAAMLLLGEGGIEKAKNVNVKSIVNQADSSAAIGNSGAASTKNIRISAVSVDSNRATAEENMASTAAILGGTMQTRWEEATVDHGYYAWTESSHFDYDLIYDGEYVERDEDGEPVYYYNDEVWFIQDMSYISPLFNNYHFYLPFDSRYFGGFVDKKDAETVVDRLNTEAGFTKWKIVRLETASKTRVRVCGYKIGEHYEWVHEKVLEWVPNPVKVMVPVEYVELNGVDPADNILKADNLNVYTGTNGSAVTGAVARTDGAKSYGLVTVGDLESQSSTSESYNVLVAGVTAEITGKARLEAHGSTNAESLGFVSGGWAAANGTTSESKAGVGNEEKAQNVSVIVGENTTLKAGSIDLISLNEGRAESAIDGNASYSLLANVNTSKQPTTSYYNTLVTIGKDARVEATSGDVRILSVDAPQAESAMSSKSFSILVNYNTTKGENEVHQVNNVDFVRGAEVSAKKNLVVQAYQTTRALAETKYEGKGGILSGNTATANNVIDRIVRINVDKAVGLTAQEGCLRLMAYSGLSNAEKAQTANIDLTDMQDNIVTTAYIESAAFVSLGNAKAYADVASTSEITVASGAQLKSRSLLALESVSTSVNGFLTMGGTNMEWETNLFKNPGITTTAEVKSEGGIPLPNTVAKSTLNFNAYVNINKGAAGQTNTAKLTSENNVLRIKASNERLYVKNYAHSLGKGAAGVANGTAWIDATLSNTVWIDAAELSGKKGIDIYADTGGMPKGDKTDMEHWPSIAADRIWYDWMPYLEVISDVKLKALGKAQATARISGTQINQIRTNDENGVTFQSGAYVSHVASDPTTSIRYKAEANAKVPKFLFIKLGKTVKKRKIEWYYFNRCDFCGVGQEYDVDPSDQKAPEERYQEAWDEALRPINEVQEQVNQYTPYERVLMPVGDISRTENGAASATRARYGEEEYLAAASIFVLDLQHILRKDVRLRAARIRPYRLWTNIETFHTVYLLPNATQLYVDAGSRPQFLVDILRGDVFGEGRARYIALYSALTDFAYRRPIVPIGSTGSLDFSTGTLTIPSFADFELYLHEVSSRWLIDQFEKRRFRMLRADQDALNNCAWNGGKLPKGEITEELIPDGGENGWSRYWLGDTPETAEDAGQTLIYLLVNGETDEVDAFRTSVNMLLAGEEPVDVSLYIFRDAEADAREEEKYDVFFFDTPETEMSIVKLFINTMEEQEEEVQEERMSADTPDDQKMVLPRGLRIILRAFPVKGSDMPAYCLNNSVLLLTKRSNGSLSALDGWYQAGYDDNTFESPYILLEGISEGELSVIIRKGQPVWPEWTGVDTAEAIDEAAFVLTDGVWYEEGVL